MYVVFALECIHTYEKSNYCIRYVCFCLYKVINEEKKSTLYRFFNRSKGMIIYLGKFMRVPYKDFLPNKGVHYKGVRLYIDIYIKLDTKKYL